MKRKQNKKRAPKPEDPVANEEGKRRQFLKLIAKQADSKSRVKLSGWQRKTVKKYKPNIQTQEVTYAQAEILGEQRAANLRAVHKELVLTV